MELPIVSALEFEQIRSSIKNYIKTKTDFKDYDFEGSNLSMLIDILTYNTMYTSYNVNMSVNELNLDTAVLRDNIVSIAKRLGYNPNSYTSAKIEVNCTVVNDNNFDSIKIKPGVLFVASANGKNYKFVVRDTVELDSRGKSSVTFENLELIEGTDFSITYTVDTSNEHQRFFVPNSFVDSDTIRAFVIADPSTNIEEEYERKNTIVDVTAESKIFFVEEVQDQKYEIIFGDDTFGRKLKNGEVIRLQYIVSGGSQANGIKIFDFVGQIYGTRFSPTPIENLIMLSNISYKINSEFSDGGSEFESIRSIKYAAPRYYASQERAVTLTDYDTIIRQIYSNADLINVVGGESLSPPRFGQVFIYIKPVVGENVSFGQKQKIKNELKKYKVGSITTQIIDKDNADVHLTIKIHYDSTKTRKTISELQSLISNVILLYAKEKEFDKFGGLYSNSELICKIKDIDKSIQFVTILVYLQKTVEVFSNQEHKYFVDFFTKLKTKTISEYYVISEPFCAVGYSTPVYLAAVGNCDYTGDLNLYSLDRRLITPKVGKVNPQTGEIEFTMNMCQTTPINIAVIPDVIEIPFGPATTPTLIIDDVGLTDKDYEETLNPDNNTLPIDRILLTPAHGDKRATNIGIGTDLIVIDRNGNPYVIPKPISTSPGGATPIRLPSPTLPPINPQDPDDPTGGTDPNDITDIDNFIPETDPTACS